MEGEMKQPILVIDVDLDDAFEVKGHSGNASMLLFHGSCDCENFKGTILPGGVDTQKQVLGEEKLLSARYILEGKDKSGKDCRIFIENNTLPQSKQTKPMIYTDSKELQWLESADLYGEISGKKGGVIISIFEK
ncbi:MAG: DUF3237 domain-containing protein [Lachnospiraceae bacterium]|nr:DUF3237 domain-containing protein [Lachnospiraceae bacterium]